MIERELEKRLDDLETLTKELEERIKTLEQKNNLMKGV